MIDWLIDWLIVCLFDWLIDWLIDCLFDWLIDWLNIQKGRIMEQKNSETGDEMKSKLMVKTVRLRHEVLV